MLFVFPRPERYSFWMKNTLIPLDIIWLNSDRSVVHLETNVPACVHDPCPNYAPVQPALYVLEVNAGSAQQFGIKKNDTAKILLR